MTTEVALKTRPQVFLSFSLVDQQFASEVANELQRSGLAVVRMSDFGAGGEYTAEIRNALHQSAAVVVALPDVAARHGFPASVLFEIGAGVGAEKPIYVIVDRPSGKLPFGAPGLQVLPLNRLDEIARKINDDFDR